MEDNVKSFLDRIQELGDKKTKVYIPSLKKDIECQQLSFKQQKDLISTIGDGSIGSLKFQKLINDIIVENTENTNILVSDKLSIILKLRIDTIGSKIKKDDDDIDILPLLENVKKIEHSLAKVITGSVTVELQVPNLVSESKIIQAAIDSVKKDSSELGKTIGNIYTYEIVKYVDKVGIGSDILELSLLPIKDRYKLIDNLPLSINKEIISFIQELKNLEKEALKYGDKSLDIDVSFFDS
jgi:hypothetical protein